ncbi:riboflavin synthase [Thermodesulfobacteriota bacterium]
MFTGLVEGIGKVKRVSRSGADVRLTVAPSFDASDIGIGDSLSVDGICLTVTQIREGVISMDVSAETISRSTMANLKPGNEVNLERALRIGDRLGGHLVSGHVDGLGKILEKESRSGSWLLKIGIPEAISKYIIEKGSIAVDGISLTVNFCQADYFELNIIPQTVKETTILKKKVGEMVNIETDMIGKYVEKFSSPEYFQRGKKRSSVIDQEMLNKHGYSG